VTKFLLPDDLYPYQKEDAEKLLSMDNGLNFSEMGIGKTPEALWIIEKGNFNLPLIICPNSLRLEWQRQIEDWIGPDLCAVGSGDSVMKAGAIIHSFKNNQKFRILNYEALRSPFMLDILSNFPFDIVIFDEIHKLRNPKTILVEGRAKKKEEGSFTFSRDKEGGVWNFLNQHQNAKIYGLSGSPIMNYPVDLYTPLSCVKSDKYPRSINPWRHFTYKYGYWADGRFGSYMYGTRNMDELKKETAPFIIRRTKKEVLPFLPEKYYRRSTLEMKPDQRKVYDQMEKELRVLLDT
jgi:SWI/SNF-related matrix-associated actin-dependent regulator 1 of chromatin subfamily A